MIERVNSDIRIGLKQLGRFLRREKPVRSEIPHYIGDNYDLLHSVDPYLSSLMDRPSFQRLQVSLQKSDSYGDEVVDIAASRNFLRGLIFLDATRTIAIDPAYKWYDHESSDPFAPTSYPHGVFGGKAEREDMQKLLQYACKDLQTPAKMNQDGATLITGERENKQRSFELLPEDANTWLLNQKPQTIANFVVYRVFPSPLVWGKIISSLRDGGTLITTGYGKQNDSWREEKLKYEPDIARGGGVDVDNSALPTNGSSRLLGLISIAQFDHVHFYRKIRHLEPAEISQAILNNQ